MQIKDITDAQYYEAVSPRSLSERLVCAARDRIFEDFIRYCQPQKNSTILDVGVSDVVNDAANVLERKYPYPERIVALGLGEGIEFKKAYPKTSYERIGPNQRLPFQDKTFDIATSNAVLEHVGSHENQMFFIQELVRVARKVFITVPNRYFPVEHHTAIPILHFWDWSFKIACPLVKKSKWMDEKNLILMSKKRLHLLCSANTSVKSAKIEFTGIGLGQFSSNLLLFIDETVEFGQETGGLAI